MKSVIDFETRSPVDIKTCGAYAYAAHPDTEVMMLAVRICGQEARVWVAPAYRHFLDTELSDDELQDIIDNCEEIAAHNAPFERAIWKFKMEPLWFKPLPLEKIRCTMSQALMCNLPRKLEQAVKVWRKDAPQKDNEGHKLMMKMSKPRKFRKAELSAFPDPEKAKATQEYVYAVLSKGGIPTIKNYHQYIVYPCDEPMFKRYVEYCRQDVVAEEVLFTELPPIPERELKVWRLDQTINDRGVGIDRFHAVKIMDMVNKVEDILTEEASEITYGAVSTMKSSKAIIEWLQSRGVDTDSASKQAISDLLERPDLPSDVRRFLEIRQTIAMSSTAKYQTMLCTSCYDGRAHGTMIYHGASTGRFSGALIQPQNLTRPSTNNMNIPEGSKPLDNYDISEMDVRLAASGNIDLIQQYWKDPKVLASDCLRAMIRASEGRVFMCADYSGIEARALAYLAGEEYVLQGFRDGLDPYKVAATTIYGVKYENVDKKQRQVGKTATLACFTADTKVYTRDGVKNIVDVTKDDYVWDGENWCLTDGAYYQGVKEVVNFLGVESTPDQKWLMGENIWVESDAGKVLLETFMEIFKSCHCVEKQEISCTQDASLAGENAMCRHGTYCLEEQLSALNADENLELKQSQNTIQWSSLTREDGLIDYTQQLADVIMKQIQHMNGMEPEELKYTMNGWKIKIPSLNICVELTIGTTQGMKSTALITTMDTCREMLGVSWDETIKETPQEIDLYRMVEELCALLIFGVSIAPNIEARELLVNYLEKESIPKKSSNQCRKESVVNTTKYITSKKFFTVEKNCLSMSFGKNMFRGTRKNLIFKLDSIKDRVLSTSSRTKKSDNKENVYDLLNCGDKSRFTISTSYGPRIVHNCGYGGGYGAFLRFGADRMGIDEEEGKKIISSWRDGHPMTVKLWNKLVEASVMAMTNKGEIYSYRGVSFRYHKRFLLMKLPSGRFLFYFDPKLEDVEMAWSTPERPAFKKLVTAMTLTPEKQFVRRPLNHLILSENLTQAFCRDLMVNALFNLEEAGYPVVFHVHDEIISEVPIGYGDIKEFEEIMCKLPLWAKDLPVKAEGWVGKFYRK